MHSESGPYRKMTEAEVAAEFDALAMPVTECGCWIWMGHGTKAGYGMLGDRYMHRYSYERHIGHIPDGMHVLHKCDVPSCVNPSHLFIGTQQDNNNDKIAKGRARGGSLKGEAHNMHKLTADEVRLIRRLYRDGSMTQVALADEFDVVQGTISNIILGKTWRHI